jgi:hypothetical protein
MATLDDINILDRQPFDPEMLLRSGRQPTAEPIPPTFNPASDYFYNNVLNDSGRKMLQFAKSEVNNPFNFAAGAGMIGKGNKVRTGIAGIGHNQGPPLDSAPQYLSPKSKAEFDKFESRAFEKSQREGKELPKFLTDETKKDQFFATKSNVNDDEFEVFAEWIESSKDQSIKNRVADVIKANKERSFGYRGIEGGYGRIDDISRKHLFQNNLVDADGNVTLYRAINLGENKSLALDKGLVSTTIDPKYVANLAKQESEKVNYVIPENMKNKVDIFDTPLDLAMKGIELEKQIMTRTPMIVQYKVPVNKVEAYLPAILNKMDDSALKSVVSRRAYRDHGDEIAERQDALRAEGYDDVYGIDDEVAHEYGIKDEIYDTLYNADLESEVILDATDLSPSGVFSLEDFIKQINIK